MADLLIITANQLPDRTIGMLAAGSLRLYTLEDTVREVVGIPVANWKINGQTAIPAGRYEVVLTMSKRFGKIMPLLLDVPGFSGIRMHSGNVPADTEGCILLGMNLATSPVNALVDSKNAYALLFDYLQKTLQSERCFLTVKRLSSPTAVTT